MNPHSFALQEIGPSDDREDVTRRRRILLHALDKETEGQLLDALGNSGLVVEAQPCDDPEALTVHPDAGRSVDAVFTANLKALAASAAGGEAETPVVVVSRLAEAEHYLEAMEAGAHDYCVAPFEPSQLRWILTTASVLKAPRRKDGEV